MCVDLTTPQSYLSTFVMKPTKHPSYSTPVLWTIYSTFDIIFNGLCLNSTPHGTLSGRTHHCCQEGEVGMGVRMPVVYVDLGSNQGNWEVLLNNGGRGSFFFI